MSGAGGVMQAAYHPAAGHPEKAEVQFTAAKTKTPARNSAAENTNESQDLERKRDEAQAKRDAAQKKLNVDKAAAQETQKQLGQAYSRGDLKQAKYLEQRLKEEKKQIAKDQLVLDQTNAQLKLDTDKAAAQETQKQLGQAYSRGDLKQAKYLEQRLKEEKEQIAKDQAALDQANAKLAGKNVAQTYTVKQGDTLTAIAKRYGIPLSELYKANPQFDPKKANGKLSFARNGNKGWDPDFIKPGDKINIPAAANAKQPASGGQPARSGPQPVAYQPSSGGDAWTATEVGPSKDEAAIVPHWGVRKMV
jgi:LysM repeat protein